MKEYTDQEWLEDLSEDLFIAVDAKNIKMLQDTAQIMFEKGFELEDAKVPKKILLEAMENLASSGWSPKYVPPTST